MTLAITYFMFTFIMNFLQVDISSQAQMSSLRERLQSLPDVAGIVHTAMVLRDEFLKDLTEENFNEVMGPKIKGKTAMLSDLTLTSQANFSFSGRRCRPG